MYTKEEKAVFDNRWTLLWETIGPLSDFFCFYQDLGW
jgi:hypothetical protein